MRFEARDVKPYAEPVTADELEEGKIYFSVVFLDEEMLYPELEPLVFVGRNLGPGDEGLVYFQDLRSYRDGARYHGGSSKSGEGGYFLSGSERETNHIFVYEKALDRLLACSLRRQRKPR